MGKTTSSAIKLSRKQIEEKAEEILAKNDSLLVPVDLVNIANQSGVKIFNAKFSDDSISAMLAKRGDNITMLINQSDYPNRKRFSIAHELGHHFLHLMEDGEMIDNEVDMFRFESSDEIEDENRLKEIQANQFAAALLMPASLLEGFYKETTDIKLLAQMFAVSEEAMGYRLNQLNLA